GVANAAGALKDITLSGSPFHMAVETGQAFRANGPIQGARITGRGLVNFLSDDAYDAFRQANSSLYERGARAGVTQLTHPLEGEGRDMLQGFTGALTRGVVGGGGGFVPGGPVGAGLGAANAMLGQLLSPRMWEKFIPTLKISTFDQLTRSGV